MENKIFFGQDPLNGLQNQVAQQMHQLKLFSYSKWELDPSHPLVAEMEQTLTEPELVESVTELLRKDYPTLELSKSREMSDFFATHYAKGDFLSPHNDGASGSWAVVISLVEDDFDGTIHGGGLQFQCPGAEADHRNPEYCETLLPKFNTAVVFGTRVLVNGRMRAGPSHQVLEVLREQGGRYALTGWWMDASDDNWSDHDKEQLQQVRARN